jgi:hypothetical protein
MEKHEKNIKGRQTHWDGYSIFHLPVTQTSCVCHIFTIRTSVALSPCTPNCFVFHFGLWKKAGKG